MQLQDMRHIELQEILAQLDQALYNHKQWNNNLVRTISCRLPCDKHDILPEAYKECRFGQWYYSDAAKKISDYPGFVAIGEAHQRMHQLTGHLLINLGAHNEVSPADYDNLANALERLRLEIYALKHELETLLYNRDPLTMAMNRITMLPLLREEQELTKRRSESCCIAMLDLDLFKNVNDQYGHGAGDKVLTVIAHYLVEHLRPYDKVFRYGGEEFLLSIQQISLENAVEMVDRIRAEIAALPIEIGLEAPIHITISCGVTLLDPNATIENSIDQADKALYMAKSSGRNCTKTWTPEMAKNNSKPLT